MKLNLYPPPEWGKVFEQAEEPVKLNLGSGGELIPGYISVDLFDKRADIQADATTLSLPECSITEIVCFHMFEHTSPYRAQDILRRWYLWLRPGCKLIMELPDIEALCKDFLAADKGTRYGILSAIYGAVNTTGGSEDITAPHLWGWYPGENGHLWDHLKWVGFGDIVFGPEQRPHPLKNFRVEATK